MKDFVAACQDNEEIANLRKEVEAFATSFPMPGKKKIYIYIIIIIDNTYFLYIVKKNFFFFFNLGFDASNLVSIPEN